MISPLHLTRRDFLTLSASTTLLGLFPEWSYANVIRDISGKVWVNDALATLQTPIVAGDTVSTGSQSKIIFVIGQDVFKLGEYSTLKLEEGGNTLISTLHLLSGKLMGAFGKGNKQIYSPSLNIGIRGTGLFMNVGAKSTYFCDCYGQTEITTLSQQARHHLLKATHHQAVVVTHDTQEANVFMGTLKYHRDEELYELESLVGRQPPASFK